MLESGHTVLMHDADVLFDEYGLRLVSSYLDDIWRKEDNYDFMVQDNGSRDTAYDGLNWGFVWMNTTTRAKSVVRCTLDRWHDDAFGCSSNQRCEDYYKRSQPRINHVLELSILSPRAVKACKLASLSTFSTFHMTGYPTVEKKLVCAKESGYLKVASHNRLSYRVPRTSSLLQQRRALQVGLLLARSLDAKLELPAVYFAEETQKLCSIFDVSNINPYVTHQHSDSCVSIHSSVDMNLTGRIQKHLEREQRVCIDFDVLNTMYDRVVLEAKQAFPLPVCDPDNPVYRPIHCCQRTDGSDELALEAIGKEYYDQRTTDVQ